MTKGFAIGIIGGLSHVQSALEKMRVMVRASIDKTQSDVTKAKARLVTLNRSKATNKAAVTRANINLDKAKHAKKPNLATIKKAQLSLKSAKTRQRNNLTDIKTTQATLKTAGLEHTKSVNAQKSLTILITRNQKELTRLGNLHDSESVKLKAAQDVLATAQKTMADAN